MKIGVGSDHAGFKYKEGIKRFVNNLGHSVEDFGTNSEKPVDYPLFIRPVALAVASGKVERGIVLGGSGNGEAMVANRLKGIRCALCWNLESARLARQHNDCQHDLTWPANDLRASGSRDRAHLVGDRFEGGRHLRRIEMIDP
jgi:ribose 5-phosphate isomerase B